MTGRNINPQVTRKKAITKAWRKAGQGRLYWRSNSKRRVLSWPAGAVAMAKNGAERTYFYSLEAMETYIAPTSIAARITRTESGDSMPARRKGRG